MTKSIRSPETGRLKTLTLVLPALFAALTAICSWVTIPSTVPFTLQTFAVFLALGVLGGKLGSVSVVVYILLGAVGLPVFSGFKGGFGVILGTTGGYIVGFVLLTCAYWLMTSVFGNKIIVRVVGMLLGLALCYAFGTIWFITVYTRSTGAVSISAALGWCVVPFIIPDLIKLTLAVIISQRLNKVLKLSKSTR